jgi:Spy/CpxP family protein refolding chaperone
MKEILSVLGLVVVLSVGALAFITHRPATSFSTAANSGPSMASNDSTSATASDANGAPGNPPPAGAEHRRGGRGLEALGLTDEQKQKIEQIRSTVTDRKERRAQIMQVLTPEQAAKWEQMRAEHRHRGEQEQGAPANGAPPANSAATPPAST